MGNLLHITALLGKLKEVFVRKRDLGSKDFYNEDLLYKLFGVNAELLIDHAWGWEPVEIADCKAYTPESKSISQGQVLTRPYSFDEGRVVVREMADHISIDLVRAGQFTDQVVLDVCYDVDNLNDHKMARRLSNETDRSVGTGRKVVMSMANGRTSYSDIIDRKHHVSEKRPQMARLKRAAQFTPFAALSGYDGLIAESARYTGTRRELAEDKIVELNTRICVLKEHVD